MKINSFTLKISLLAFCIFLGLQITQAQTTILTDNFSTPSNWSYLANSSSTTAQTPSSSSNPAITGGKAKLITCQGSYENESRIYKKISATGNTGIIGSDSWYVDIEFTRLTNSSSVPNNLTLVMINESNRGLQYRNSSSSTGMNNITCLGVGLSANGAMQLFENAKGTSVSTYTGIDCKNKIAVNTTYYARFERIGDSISINVYTSSTRTGTAVVSDGMKLTTGYTTQLDNIVIGLTAGWGISSNGFSAEIDSVSVVNNKLSNTVNTVTALKFDNFLVKVFPNPATDFFNIKTNFEGGFELRLYNLSGTLVQQFHSEKSSFVIETKNLLTGIYLLQGVSFNEIFSEKIIIE